MKPSMPVKILRIASQVLFFGLFVFVFFRSLNPFTPGENPFLRFDILVFLTHMQDPWRYVLPIAAILILTAVIGRFFCGWVCPLGSLIEFLDTLTTPVRRINPLEKHVRNLETKLANTPPSWALLGIVSVTVFFVPPVLQYLHPNVWIIRIFSLSALGLGFLGFLFVLSILSRRFWCTMMCPLGALYGLIASLPFFRLSITKCSGCGKCDTCPMKAVQYRTKTILPHQCILCFDYEARCPVNGFSYGRINRRNEDSLHDESRRKFLRQSGILVGGIVAGSLFSYISGKVLPPIGNERKLPHRINTGLIRPPGVTAIRAEKDFIKRCLRCLQCVKSCPNEIIKITGSEYGFANLFTPHVRFEEYGCDFYCQVCQLVCPNYAIPLQTLEEKQRTTMGLASVNPNLCVVYTENTNCLVCEEMCPVPEKAIKVREEMKLVEGEELLLRYPDVKHSLCIGCGACEVYCPVLPKAITVARI
jgi:polyferredoxin/ferredoxin